MQARHRDQLYREFIESQRRLYGPAAAVAVIALWEYEGNIWCAYRNWFYEGDIHGQLLGSDGNANLWPYCLFEPGPPGDYDPITGIHWNGQAPVRPVVPGAVREAVAQALTTPWRPPQTADELPYPVTVPPLT